MGSEAFGNFVVNGKAKWAHKILHPPSRLAKIGVKPGWRVAALGIEDQDFLDELEAASAVVSIGRATKACDAIFFGNGIGLAARAPRCFEEVIEA